MSTLFWTAWALLTLLALFLSSRGHAEYAGLIAVLSVAGCVLYWLGFYYRGEKLDDRERKISLPRWEGKLDDWGEFLGELLMWLLSTLAVLAFIGAVVYFVAKE